MTTNRLDDNLLLNALADGELDAAASIALEQRLAGDPSLAAEYGRIRAVKAAVQGLERPVPSEAFLARIDALAEASGAAPARAAQPRNRWTEHWRATAAAALVAAALSSALTYSLMPKDVSLAIRDQIVGGHRRSLLAASAIDIASSDRHTVRPWFDAKLGLAPPTPDLGGKGFPLVGGRIEVVAGQPVPALVYRRGPHLITVVALPEPGRPPTAPLTAAEAGFNTVQWTERGFRFWAVSDLDAAELSTFVAALRAAG